MIRFIARLIARALPILLFTLSAGASPDAAGATAGSAAANANGTDVNNAAANGGADNNGAVEKSTDGALAAQRTLFLQTRTLLQNNQFDAAAPGMAALKDYPLYPYLELQLLSATLAERFSDSANAAAGNTIGNAENGSADSDSDGLVDDFLRRYAGSLVAEQLRNTWLALLAQNNRWSEYRKYYVADSSGKNAVAKQQLCWNLEALYQTQQFDSALTQTGEVWLNTDLPDTCDDALKRWLDSNQRSEPLAWKRLLLALEHRQEKFARLLAVNIREPYKLSAEYALLLYRDPAALNNLLPQLEPLPESGAIITLALKNLAKRDVDAATNLWQQLRDSGRLSPENSNAARAEIGRQQIVQYGVDALPWLLQNDAGGEDAYLLEWRIRLALAGGDWPLLTRWIESLPANLAQTPRWSYWRARALAAQDDSASQQRAATLWRELAKERNYYGFLAADRLKINYQLNDQRLTPKTAPATVAQQPALLRAREFFALGENANARREWLFALRTLNNEEQQSAALLAEQWGWHDRAIQTAGQAGAWNDLQLRFPLAYRDSMLQAARNSALPSPWLFAIARQESTFMPDARSPVGALGLMQLMPDTARQVARGLRSKISSAQLLQPEPNIRLGSAYLSEMLRRYGGNRVLATAAYNAGPNRISRILKNQQSALPTDIWVEILPYRETRDYVQNVLSFAVIYGRRLGIDNRLLSGAESSIGAAALQIGSTGKP